MSNIEEGTEADGQDADEHDKAETPSQETVVGVVGEIPC
jgi:hypothetical protein